MKTAIRLSLVFGLVSLTSQADISSLDELRWFLKPMNQTVELDIDDINSEFVKASPKLDWGYSTIASTKPKKPVRIAVIDGGVNVEHETIKAFVDYNDKECLENRAIPPDAIEDKDGNGLAGDCVGYNFVEDNNRADDKDGHGTHVTSAITNILRAYPGEFKIVPIRALNAKDSLSEVGLLANRLAKAIRYAVSRKVDIIHLSLGWPKDGMRQDLFAAIQEAKQAGILIVTASGNSSQQNTPWGCRLEGMICVGALRPNAERARFSNFGNMVDLFLPGEKILSAIPNYVTSQSLTRKGYDYKNGSSQAAPIATAQLAYLKSLLPDLDAGELTSRFLSSSERLGFAGDGFGIPKIPRAVSQPTSVYAMPDLKNLDHAILAAQVTIPVTFVNRFKTASVAEPVQLECKGLPLAQGVIPAISAKEKTVLNLALNLGTTDSTKTRDIECTLKSAHFSRSLTVRLAKNLPNALENLVLNTDKQIIAIRPVVGAAGNLVTLSPLLKKQTVLSIYEIVDETGSTLVGPDIETATLPKKEGCRRIRFVQYDSDPADGYQLGFALESICADDRLEYEFFDSKMKSQFGALRFRPELTTVNFENLILKLQKNAPPIFTFVNMGLLPVPKSPWKTPEGPAPRPYNLVPVKKDAGWVYEAESLERADLWAKSLGLRYTPSFSAQHMLDHMLIVRTESKTAWVNLETQHAEWAPELDGYFWAGSRMQTLAGGDTPIFQILITTQDYRGLILPNTSLSYRSPDIRDPMIAVNGTQEVQGGYVSYVRTLYNILVLKYSGKGGLVSKEAIPIDRFDFLGVRELVAIVYTVEMKGKFFQIVDGTRISTNSVDVLSEGERTRYMIPDGCVSQRPLVYKERITLPLLCRTEAGARPQLRMVPLD